jgi:hypothetical protein
MYQDANRLGTTRRKTQKDAVSAIPYVPYFGVHVFMRMIISRTTLCQTLFARLAPEFVLATRAGSSRPGRRIGSMVAGSVHSMVPAPGNIRVKTAETSAIRVS